MEDQFAAETPMKSFGRSKSPYSHRFASFRRRSSARTNSFVSRAKATSFFSTTDSSEIARENDSGKNDVEELKSLFRHKHESIIDLNKQVEIENKDGDEGPESQRASSSINSRLEDMGFLSPDDFAQTKNEAGSQVDRRTRASSVDGQLSSKKSLSESLYKSQNSFDNTNHNNNRTHDDKKNVVSEIEKSSGDHRRGDSKGKRNAPTNSADFKDVIVKNNATNLSDFSKLARKQNVRVIGWMLKKGRMSRSFKRRFCSRIKCPVLLHSSRDIH